MLNPGLDRAAKRSEPIGQSYPQYRDWIWQKSVMADQHRLFASEDVADCNGKTSIRLHACSRDPIAYSREHDHKRSAIPKQQILYAVMAEEGPLRGHDRIFPGSASTRWTVGNLAEIAPRDLTSLDQESETPTLETFDQARDPFGSIWC